MDFKGNILVTAKWPMVRMLWERTFLVPYKSCDHSDLNKNYSMSGWGLRIYKNPNETEFKRPGPGDCIITKS